MAVLTEEMLRRRLRKTGSKTITIEDGVLLTPSAREFIKSHDLYVKQEDQVDPDPKEDQETCVLEDLYTLYEGPGYLKDKPFYMAEIQAKTLIAKDHPRYVFFQRLDVFLAQVLIDLEDLPDKDRVVKEGLEDLYWILVDLKEKEEKKDAFKSFQFLGMTEDALDEKLGQWEAQGQNPLNSLGPGSRKTSLKLFRLHGLLRELESRSLDPQVAGGKDQSLGLAQQVHRSLKGLFYLIHLSA